MFGNASIETGHFAELASAVVQQLPRDIDSTVAQGWIENRSALQRVLRAALLPNDKPAGNVYSLTVNYGLSVEDAVKLGRYDWANSDINSSNFQTKRSGTAEVVVELIHFNRYISTKDALSELDRMGYRTAELHELLAFGEKYPNVQREFPVVALGSVWQDRSGVRDIPYLGRYGSERGLYLDWVGHGWDEVYWYAAVRK